MNLLIDIGNTRLKWAITNELKIESGAPINNVELSREALIQAWHTFMFPPERLAIACVGPFQLLELVLSVAKELWPSIVIVRPQSEPQSTGVSNAYREPEKLGIDRWLTMTAAFSVYQKALCIVGCGTAITLDIIDSSGNHLGGLICPGLRLMRDALATRTENLEPINGFHPFGLANHTNAAIFNGTLAAACGLIEHVLKNQTEDFELLLTGGDAALVAAQLGRPVIIEPDLVLHGLALTLKNY
jgi:type III pantothenate kinase